MKYVPGLSHGVCNYSNTFELDARKAGYGDFDINIQGSSRALVDFTEEEDAHYIIVYKVATPGNYYIEIKFDKRNIPGNGYQ